MQTKQTDPKATGGAVHENGDPTADEVNRLHDLLDDETEMRRIDVLEDMLDIMNEQ